MTYHQIRYYRGRQGNYHNRSTNTHPKPKESFYQPLPKWERQFCTEVGAMSWRRFVAAKENLCESDKVFEWDDSAGLKAFQEAKQRFWESYHGHPCKTRLPIRAEDMYIDENIDWNPKIDPKLFSELKSLSDDEDDEKDKVKDIKTFSIPLEEIKPTGWVLYEEPTPQLRTIVGSD
ncbi:uncharacterized protein LOC120144061 [Hibiscus syriacus]|uniref:uncharacterized protein LOC120144061 n=1 Tax=Hibiscus syriacus TaxID=106335 RepID=UPI0019243DB9|nr:uncharacterized protein LOC120144061 [Hibiscus syriacus]